MEVMSTLEFLHSYTNCCGLDDLRKQAIAIEESLKTTPDFVKSFYEESKRESRSKR
jgi:cytochrome c oxidase cbb3-type subunit I/II